MVLPLGKLYEFIGDSSMALVSDVLPLYMGVVTKLAYAPEVSNDLLYKINRNQYIPVNVKLDTSDIDIYRNTLENISPVLLMHNPNIIVGDFTDTEPIRVGDMFLGIIEKFDEKFELSVEDTKVLRSLTQQVLPAVQQAAPNTHYHKLFSFIDDASFNAVVLSMRDYLVEADFNIKPRQRGPQTLDEVYTYSEDEIKMKAMLLEIRHRIMLKYLERRHSIPIQKRVPAKAPDGMRSNKVSKQEARNFYSKIKDYKTKEV